MGFKEAIAADNRAVFMNLGEFAEPHQVNGKEMAAMIDDNEMVEREKRYKEDRDGIYKKQMLLYVQAEEFGKLPPAKAIVALDGKRYLVTDAIDEGGIYSISLEANRS